MDAAEIFRQICIIIENSPQDVSPISYTTWIKTLQPLVFKNNFLYLIVPSEMHRRHILTSNGNILHSYLTSALNIVINSPGASIELVLETEAPAILEEAQEAPKAPSRPMLNEKYTFESFVVGSANAFAHAAAVSVAEAPATINNPLFIYGGVGLGKTHLMHAIGNYVLEQNPNARVLYATSERYTNEFIDAVSKHQITAFREKYRNNVDLLMIDDVQFWGSNMDRTQEEIFHNINDLFNANKQIVLSSDRHPSNLSSLTDRLRSRFMGGLLVDIAPPDLETRVAILRRKAESEHIQISDKILFLIAEKASDNVRELEGALKRVLAYSAYSSTPSDITVEVANNALRDYHTEAQKNCTPEMIINTVANYFSIEVEDILGTKREKTIALPRQIAYYLCDELTDLSSSRIGDEFNGRDHSTILNGIGKIRSTMKINETIRNYVEDITMHLKGE